MSKELLVIDTGFQARNSDLQARKTNWTSLFRIVPASDELEMWLDLYWHHWMSGLQKILLLLHCYAC
jgi:hypothetical protein